MDRSCVMQLNSLVEGNQEFRRSSMLHIMVLLKFLGSYGNEAALEKLGLMLGISKGSVNNYVRQACNAILKHLEHQVAKYRGAMEYQWQDQKGSRFC